LARLIAEMFKGTGIDENMVQMYTVFSVPAAVAFQTTVCAENMVSFLLQCVAVCCSVLLFVAT